MGYAGFGCIWLTPHTLSSAPAAASYESNTETLDATLSCDVVEVDEQEVPARGRKDDENGLRGSYGKPGVADRRPRCTLR